MFRLSAIPWLLLFLLFAPFAAHAGKTKYPKQSDAARIDAIAHQYGYDRPDAPGMSVIVIKDGKVLCKKAYGLADVESRIPNTTRTNFRLASLSKQFTAMAILILMERGKLRLDHRLTDFFPDFPAYGREITVRQLLNHTSGLPDYAWLIPADQKEQLNDEDVLRILEQQKAGDFPPGTRFEYSNSGYVILGLIVSKVSGVPFARFLKENIFQPLKMSNTAVLERGLSNVKNRAFGYSPQGDRFVRTDQSRTSATQGDGCIYSSVEDMYRWDQALYTTRLVSANTLKQAFTPGKIGADQTSGYGFGWAIDTVRGFRKIFHGGGTIGFRNHILRLPDQKFTVIVLTNRNDGEPVTTANRIARSYFPGLAAPEPRIVKVPPSVLDAYTGHYDVRGNISTFTARTGRLFWAGIGARPLELLPLSRDTFFYADADLNPERNWWLTFVKDAQGHIKEFIYKADGKEIFKASYLGPLVRTIKPQPDPDPALTRTVEAILKALAQGGKAVEEIANLAPGARKDFSHRPFSEFAGLQTVSFMTTQDVAERGMQRHGGKVNCVLTYKFATDKATRYVLIYVTADGLVTDFDVVDS